MGMSPPDKFGSIMSQVTTAAPFNLRSEARHAAAEEKLAALKAEVAAAAKRAASFKVGAVAACRLHVDSSHDCDPVLVIMRGALVRLWTPRHSSAQSVCGLGCHASLP